MALQSACSDGAAAGDDASAASADAASASDSAADVSADVPTADAEAEADVSADAADAAEASVDVSPVDVGPCPVDGIDCDDGDPCSAGDRCKAGVCLAGAIQLCECEADADCAAKEDGDLCNGTLRCQQNVCVVDPKTVVSCDPTGDAACAKAACNKATGTCALAPVAKLTPCDDGDPCTVADGCDAGQCKAGADLCQCKSDADCKAFDDENACNGTLICSKNACVLDSKSLVSCDTSADTLCAKTSCQPATGACVQAAVSDGVPCNDGQPCTVGDACAGGKCAPGFDVCECKTDGDCQAKEDGDLCNGTLTCKQNKCAINPATLVTCPTAPPCNQVACIAKTGLCATSAVAGGVGCDDGDACTPNDACQNGACTGGPTTCTGPTWAEVYKLAIQGNGCSGCHGGYSSQSQAYQTVINGFHCGGKLVVPGNAAASTLVAKMVQGVPLSCGDKMPDNTPGISKAAGDALQAWINAGAKP